MMTSHSDNAQASAEAKNAAFSILMVEDSPPQAMKLKISLENSGYNVYWAGTGNEGLQAVRQQPFDLILLDIELPDTNGFEICRLLKADPDLQEIPVIMLTTRDHAEDALSGLSLGAVDYIPKDAFAEMVLLETIKQMRGE
jgi:two-component system copper resistance phosphate regulon response regulator CusR